MKRRLLLNVIFLFGWIFISKAQEIDPSLYRTIDGTQNNPDNPRWGAAGENLLRLTSVGYADGISVPGGEKRPNPRYVSNLLFAQPKLLSDPLGLSDYTWVFGQFLDHDIGITPDSQEPALIKVPTGDPWFDPARTGSAVIPMMRNIHDPETGTSIDNPREHPNLITAFIDGSGVYGSDQERADWLRTFTGGKLKTSAGNLLPYNTTNGEIDGEVEEHTPEMDDPVGLSDKIFVAGDVRANENPLLASLHILFVREHNRLCDQLAIEHPDWDDEQLYQHARKIVGGLIQAITYEEWLPAMGVLIEDYTGYKADVNPQLMNVFTAAAFRMGHTLLSGSVMRMGSEGEIIEAGNMRLADAFFNPFAIPESGMEPFLRGMAVQTQQSFDSKLVDDVRNFLFGPPGAGGLDLASININRGRERGLADFNTIRRDLGLKPYRIFGQLNHKIGTFTRLQILYRSVNWVDPWVGMLAENRMPGALFGETVLTILERQFTALRDGDRFYYVNDPVLSEAEKEMIRNTRFSEIIIRNSDVELMQENVFYATDRDVICPDDKPVEIGVETDAGDPIADVSMTLQMEHHAMTASSTPDGTANFDEVPSCEVASVALAKSDDLTTGVTTLDLIKIQKHIIGTEPLGSHIRILAADVNNSNTITALDLVKMRQAILGIITEFPNNKGIWNFIPADYSFTDPENPFEESMPLNGMAFEQGVEVADSYTFIGVKTGDVNNSFNTLLGDDSYVGPRSAGALYVEVSDRELVPGAFYTVDFNLGGMANIAGYQFALQYDRSALTLDAIDPSSLSGLTLDHFAHFADRGLVTTSWNADEGVFEEEGGFSFTFRADRAGRLSDYLTLSKAVTPGEAYSEDLRPMSVQLSFDGMEFAEERFHLGQNTPNPFQEHTTIDFYLPEQNRTKFTVFDAVGKILFTKEELLTKGSHQWQVDREQISGSGVLYYRVETESTALTRKMILLK